MNSSSPNGALGDAARREKETLDRLRTDLKDKNLVIVVGAGVTLSATADLSGKPLPRLTWTGLICNGLDYLVSGGYVEASNRRIKYAYEALHDSDPSSLLDAAGILADQMTKNGQFPTWLESMFGRLHQEVRYRSLLEVLRSLHRKGATLLTTNYDDLLERFCGLRGIGRSNRDDVLKFKRGDLDGVFHVHGSYHDPHEVVLDNTQYYQVTHTDEIQNVLRTFLEYRTILFIGCGSSLEDPNFGALLKWVSERHGNIPNRHCLLIRDGDDLNHKVLVRVKYGPQYGDLARYLQRLLDEPPTPIHDSEFSRTDSSDFTKEEKDCLQSLSFLELETRQTAVRRPLPDTFTWIFERPEYKDWLERRNTSKHKGLLWIKGKPGSGKSVLMKQMLIRTQNAQPSSSTISFFFNGRGTLLEMRPLGLFRSLLHQLFRQQRYLLESFLPKFRTKRDTLMTGWEWQEGELSDYFSDVIRNTQTSSMTVFIDALDECEYESDMRRLVSFFANLSSYAISSNYNFKVCLSSRHYPHISVAGCEEIFLEMWNSPDILKYVQSELRLEDTTGRSFQGDVMEKASGIFLWVVLVVASLVKERDEGRTVREMRQQLEELPDQLDELFTNYFESVSARDRLETLHLMQWILFAQRPLTAAEVYCALAFCVEPPPRSQKAWQEGCLDNEPQIESRLRTLSKGLVEIKEVDDDQYLRPPYSLRVVQFIHESVRDFLIHRDGLLILDSSLGQLIPGKSHDLLARACINYLSTEEFQTNSMIGKAQADRLSDIDEKHADRIIMEYEQYILWDYAITSMFDHASRAESGGVDQRYLALIFHVRRRKEFDDWRFFYDCLHADGYGDIQGPGTMFLHIASEYGLLSCVHELLSQGVDVNVRGGSYRYALIAAASEGHTAIAQILLQRGDKAARDEHGMTALHWAAREGHIEMLRLLLEEGLDVTTKDQNGMTALHMAASSGVGEALIVPILNVNGVDVDSIDKNGRTALHLAAEDGHHVMVQLLLNAGACVTVIDKGEKTALHYAAESGNEETVALLLKNGADVAVKDKNGRTVLHGGADRWRENVMIMQLLIAKGADAMAKDKNGVTPLHLAAGRGNEKTTRLLLDCGADATVSTKNEVTVLHQAAGSWKENEVIVRLLIDKGANVAAKDGKGTIALHFAAGRGHLEIVNRLVELEADTSAQTKDGWRPIHFAAQGGHLEVIDRLVELETDASAQTKDGWQPIHFAAQGGHLEVINRLVELEADASAQTKDGWQPIHFAARHGRLEVINYLVELGVDASA